MAIFDFKKEYKNLYLPKNKPVIIDVPTMRFIMVDGKGDPNTSPFYKEAVEVLYGLSYFIKMNKGEALSQRDILITWFRRWKGCGGSRANLLMAVLLEERKSLIG